MTPSINSTFKGEEEKYKSNIFIIDFIKFITIGKIRDVLGNGYLTLTIKLQLRQPMKIFIKD